MRKLISIMLAILTLLAFTSCKENNNSGNLNNNSGNSGIINTEKNYVGAEENLSIHSTGEYLIKEGKSDYKIVYDADGGGDVLNAVTELNLFVGEATGMQFPVVKDDGLTYSASDKYISVGQTSVWESAQIVLNEELGNDGTQIVTKGKSVFLFGQTGKGALYAVYDFLYYILDFDYMYKDVYSLDKNVKDIELKQYNLVNVPDIPIRATVWGWIESDASMMNRMRCDSMTYILMSIGASGAHNSMYWVNHAIEGHEGYWIGTCNDQLCYTARGNAEEYEAMQEACMTSLIKGIKTFPNAKMVCLSQEDRNTWCSCDACTKIKQTYGTDSAILILFLNDLRAKLDAWFETEEGKPYYRDLDITIMSYHKTETAPASYDEALGKWVPNNGIYMAEGTGVWYCGISADYTHTFYDEQNKASLSTQLGWKALTDNIYSWYYTGPFFNHFALYDNFDTIQTNYQLAAELGSKYLFDQAQNGAATVPFAWGALKSYLQSELMWNTHVDVNKLIDKFFKAAYGPVAQEMKDLFCDQRVHTMWLKKNTSYSCSRSASNGDIGCAEFWPKPILEDWLNRFNGILAKLDDVKRADPELYEYYYYNIALERLCCYAHLVDIYSYNTAVDTLLQYKTQFIADATDLNIGITCEQGQRSLADIKNEWGMN